MKTILLVEDDLAIARGLTENLRQEGYRVFVEKDGIKGYERARIEQPDLVILDVMLPSLDGFEICALLKKEGFGAPIFILTGLAKESSKLEGLLQGADDYVVKPFSIQELLLRIRNALRQTEMNRGRANVLESEFRKARKIQMASLPRRQPRVACLEVFGKTIPASEVGGDYFDYFKLDSQRLGIIVADVSGKGLPAAMYVQKMQGIVQSSARRKTDTADILIELHDQLHDSMDKTSFITAVVAQFNLESRTLQIAQAGHLPVLFVRDARVRLMKPPGIWIGASSTGTFRKNLRPESIAIKTGDKFIFYSDGVNETTNGKGKEFGLPRLKELVRSSDVSAHRLVDRCFAQLVKFSGNHVQSDDITIVAVRIVNEHPGKGNSR